ncbi:YheC/YheD family protein [Lysinibacillus sp. 54212]|uniref:YheC/YheD family protein n=1 Tax=Lysinibacillus sp. 54212 TaxID=3119829 RepID=UPI002FCAAE1C
MKRNRGRLGQYKVLASEEKLQQYLVETQRYSFRTLLSLLERYDCVSLKQTYGAEEVLVYIKNNSYVIAVENSVLSVSDGTSLREVLEEQLEQSKYVIQPVLDWEAATKKVYRSIITLHRATRFNEWEIVWKNSSCLNLFEQYAYYASFDRIKEVLTLVAEKLYDAYPDCQTIDIEITYTFNSELWIYDTTIHYAVSKWSQYHALSSNTLVAPLLPKTSLLNYKSFRNFMYRYWEVVIKPCYGQHGNGIVKVEKKLWQPYDIHALNKIRNAQHIDEIYTDLKGYYFSAKPYIVQRRIPLATVENCPIDVRVMLTKVNGEWRVTGKIVKVAGENFFITNAVQKVLKLEEAIEKSSLWWKDSLTISKRMDEICLEAANHLDQQVLELQHIGFDLGITNSGRIWLFEGNYKPDISMFYELDDKSIYDNVMNHIRDAKNSS